jgi:glycosyltransferase involved in cell wall biosynthesis
MGSIVPRQDVYRTAPPARCLVASEPEHLCWYPPTIGRRKIQAEKTIGLSMTDYETYIRMSDLPFAGSLARLVSYLHGRALRLRIDLPLSLSPALTLPGVTMPVERVTGVMPGYAQAPPVTEEVDGIYFLGAFLWEKGLDDLARIASRSNRPVDVIGGGRDETEFRAFARQEGANLRFFGPNRRFWSDIGRYRVMVNPSRSEILCTATADALVAGRHVILPDCPGNLPFKGYPNAHFYTDLDGALAAMEDAMNTIPEPPVAARRDFDWMKVCRRLAVLGGLEERA